MIHILFVPLKDLTGMIRVTVVINVVMISLFMTKLKRLAEFVLIKKISINLQKNAFPNQFHLNALQMNTTTLNLNNVKSEVQHQCVHLPLHTGIL